MINIGYLAPVKMLGGAPAALFSYNRRVPQTPPKHSKG